MFRVTRASTEVDIDRVNSVDCNDNEFGVPELAMRAKVGHSMSQLDSETQVLEGSTLEVIALPLLIALACQFKLM